MVSVSAAASGMHLFTMDSGAAPRVEDLPGPSSAWSSMTADRAGVRTIYRSDSPGVWRLRDTGSGWMREDAVAVPATERTMVGEGRSIDETHAFVAYLHVRDLLPRLAARDGSCWRVTQLASTMITSIGMDVDSLGRPWVAWITPYVAPGLTMGLVGPDGTAYTPWTGPVNDGTSYDDRPVVLADGLTGKSSLPAVASQRADDLHVAAADGTQPVWVDRVVPGSARAVLASNCPTGGIATNPCHGTCTHTMQGALRGYGVTRTASGRSYAGWLEADTTTTLNVEASSPGCATAESPTCTCYTTPIATTGAMNIVIARVTAATTPPDAIRRLRLDPIVEPSSTRILGSFAMVARGDTLLVVVSVGTDIDTNLRYFELDSASLP